MSLLSVHRLSKTFTRHDGLRRHAVAVVDDVSLHLDAGETLAVVGESGAGKSTLGLLIMRLLEPDGGRVRLDGTDLTALNGRRLRQLRTQLQMVPQDPWSALNPLHPVLDAVAEPRRVMLREGREEARAHAGAMLERVGLGAAQWRKRPHQFSGGQLQRVAIARAMVCDPKVVVCDEAVASLDVSIQAQVLNLLLELQRERGTSYLFIAHDLAVVRAFADRVAVMQRGRLCEVGQTQQVFESPVHEYTATLVSALRSPRSALRARLASTGPGGDADGLSPGGPAPAGAPRESR